MNRVIFFVSLLVAVSVYSQKFYYYAGEKVMLQLSDSVVVYSSDYNEGKNICARTPRMQTMHKSHIQCPDTQIITSKEYIIQLDGQTNRKMSNHFYVKLRKSTDYDRLLQLVERTRTIIIGAVPNMNNWYDLIVANSLFDNSLDMANYFYETGLFSDVDPGFVFEYKPSCVSDLFYSSQWNLPAINACSSWTITSGDTSIIIAVVDRGVETFHNEFQNTHFTQSYDCVTHSSPAQVYSSSNVYHGMYTTGIISADHNHNYIAGVTPLTSIMTISHPLTNYGEMSADMASGISWAVLHNADVINCSWGDQGGQLYTQLHSSILENAISNALTYGRNGKGCVVVFASGNWGEDNLPIDYPGRVFPNVLIVGAVNSTYNRASFSSYGDELDVVAPGEMLYTAEHGNSIINNAFGTSLAAPHVSAIASQILTVNPNLTNVEVANIIERTAQKTGIIEYYNKIGRLNGKWNNKMGYGLVNAYAAVLAAKNMYIQNVTYCNGTNLEISYPEIYAGYSVTNNKPYGNVIMQSGSEITFKAVNKIELKPGFHVEQGATFTAFIDSPAQQSSAPSNVRRRENATTNNYENNTITAPQQQANVAIAPNPVNTILYVQTTEELSQLNIYNLNGQCVLLSTQTDIDVSALPQGMYILRAVTSDGTSHQAKFIKE